MPRKKVKFNKSVIGERVARSGVNVEELSVQLGHAKGYIASCLMKGEMEEKTLESLLDSLADYNALMGEEKPEPNRTLQQLDCLCEKLATETTLRKELCGEVAKLNDKFEWLLQKVKEHDGRLDTKWRWPWKR